MLLTDLLWRLVLSKKNSKIFQVWSLYQARHVFSAECTEVSQKRDRACIINGAAHAVGLLSLGIWVHLVRSRSRVVSVRDHLFKGCILQGMHDPRNFVWGHIVMDPAYIRFNSLQKVFKGLGTGLGENVYSFSEQFDFRGHRTDRTVRTMYSIQYVKL